MKRKSAFKLIISEITAIALNVIPLALWFFEDYTVETIVILYGLESVLTMVFALLCVLLLAPREQYGKQIRLRTKKEVFWNFGITFGFGTFVILSFPATVIFLLKQGAGVSGADIIFGLQFILAFQLLEFFSNLYLLRPLSLVEGEVLLTFSFGGMAVIFISIFLAYLAAAIGISIYLPFIVLKTIVDIGQPIQYFYRQARRIRD